MEKRNIECIIVRLLIRERKILNPEITIRLCNYIQVAPGAVWGPRYNIDHELVYVVSGRFTYDSAETGIVSISADQCLLIPPNVEHTLKECSGASGSISCVHLEPPPDLGEPDLITECRAQPEMQLLFKRLTTIFESSLPLRNTLLQSLVRSVWLCLLSSAKHTEISPRVAAMLKYLDAHLYSGPGRMELAERFKMTPEHVNAIFRRELNTTPTEYVNRQRIYRAYRLLTEEGCRVKEAAEEVGFCDAFYFSKVFKRVIGFPPKKLSG